MLYFLLLLGLTSIFDETNAYALVQVKKGNNESNVDAQIQKLAPSDAFKKIADHLTRRQSSNYKRFEVIQRADDKSKEQLDSIVLALDTGLEQGSIKTKPATRLDGIDKIEKVILDLVKGSKDGPIRRAREYYNIRPELIRFKNKKPSVMVNLNSGTIINAVKDLLSSRTIKNYADKVAMKAAFVYRALKDELGHDRNHNNKHNFD